MSKRIAGPATKTDLTIFQPIGTHQQRADLAAVQTLARPNTDPTPTKILIQALDQNVRFTVDGSMPTPAFGIRLAAGAAAVIITYHQSTVLQFIEETQTAVLTYCWGH